MKITILAENLTFTDDHFFGEPGPSYWIEADGKNILFDTGFSDLFVANAQKLGVDLKHKDAIVLSHGHNDHATGLKDFPCPSKSVSLIAHPDALIPKYGAKSYIGASISAAEAEARYAYTPSAEPYFITPNIAFLGEIPQVHNFEPRAQVGNLKIGGKSKPDYLIDDSALAVNTAKGVAVVTGCSHSGICNIIEQAKKVFGVKTIHSVLGGFHLRSAGSERLQKVTDFFAKNVTGTVYAGHCTGFNAKYLLNTRVPVEEAFVGKIVQG
ncbi:MAG TPA: MBL fold metallo-hydrolase [Candidatus Saccharimonadales bacterium]|nr:MBL fold metallo-hydrolase [Candidatus Saccharimonadales bacterium]